MAVLDSAPASTAVGHSKLTTYRADIDGLRALAIGLVLLYHAFPSYVPAGFVGVDVFFVISGYLITGILLDRRARGTAVPRVILDFYQRRIKRIFPALIVVLVACAIYGWFRLFPADYENLTKYIAGGAAFVSNFLLAAEAGYFDQAAELKPLMHLWSLAIEEQFYIVWPLLILLVGKITRGRYFPWIFGALVVASFCFGLYLTPVDPTNAYYSPLSRGWELGVGGILASLHASGVKSRTTRGGGVVAIVALLSIPVGALLIDKAQFPGWQALVPVLATAAIIWFGAGTLVDRRLLGTRPIVFIGLISFPLYLWHWVVLSFLRIEHPAPSGLMLIGALVASVLLAAATYLFIEKPLKRRRLQTVSAVALIAMAVVLAFALTAHLLKWSGVQLTPTQAALSQAYDPRPDYRFGTCFIDAPTQHGSEFAPECSGDGGSQPTVLLWGDSLAAQLYPGLRARDDLGYQIAQRTATSCPPSTTPEYSDRGNCNDINDSTRAWIEQHHPEAVVLNGRWSEDEATRASEIGAVTGFLESQGVKTIVLVGPTPDWYPDLRGLLIRQSFPDDVLPERLAPPAGTWPATQARDVSLSALADSLGIQYFSMTDRLCDDDGCLIRVSDDIPAGLVTSDHDHLTAEASAYALRELALPAPH
ncbi:MAG: putative lipopolysaccharide modification acyltransferase [Rhodoglobus sp.]|nr:putative lipopolysaccharide modification acyltransferase [Rhodoglobus sp.]